MNGLTILCMICFIANGIAQQNVGIGTQNPVSSAMLDITSENKGLLIPRVALTTPNSAAPVTGVVEGMLVYNTNAAFTTQGGGGKGFYYWSGFFWDRVKTGSDSWSLNGNQIFDTANTFLGTLGNLPLKFRVGGVRAGSIERVNENLYLGMEAGARTIFTVPDGGIFPPERNTFLGSGAGRGQITGNNNTYVGAAAGRNATGGSQNTVIGSYAGAALSGGSENTFVGFVAGGSFGNGGNKNTALGNNAGSWLENSIGNTMVGHRAGQVAKAGSGNVVVGNDAGVSGFNGSGIGNHNVIMGDSSAFSMGLGNRNTLVGRRSGLALNNGNNNVMVGDSAGYNNTTGSNNTFVGKGARGNTATLQNAAAIGNLAMAGANNVLVLGSINEVNGATTSVNVGIGTTTPNRRLYIQDGTSSGVISSSNSLLVLDKTGGPNYISILNGNTFESGLIFARPNSPQPPFDAGIFYNSINTQGGMQFRNDGGLTRMVIVGNGNIGVGTTSPGYLLHISKNAAGNGSYTGGIMIENTSATTGEPAISFKNAGTNGTGANQWILGLDQSSNFSYAYGTAFTGANRLITIDTEGNMRVGSGAGLPLAKLHVDGDARISGKVTRPSSGANNMVPIAYGNISANGTINASTGNFTVNLVVATNVYEIVIAGENYNGTDYITQITPIGTAERTVTTGNNTGNRMTVRIRDGNGTVVANGFQFVTYKP